MKLTKLNLINDTLFVRKYLKYKKLFYLSFRFACKYFNLVLYFHQNTDVPDGGVEWSTTRSLEGTCPFILKMFN